MKLLLPRGPETVFKSGVTYASLDAEQREMLDDYLQYRAADVAVEMREKKAAGKIGIFPPRGWWTHRPLEQHRAAVHAWKAWIEMK